MVNIKDPATGRVATIPFNFFGDLEPIGPLVYRMAGVCLKHQRFNYQFLSDTNEQYCVASQQPLSSSLKLLSCPFLGPKMTGINIFLAHIMLDTTDSCDQGNPCKPPEFATSIDKLEKEVRELRQEIADLKKKF